MCYFFAGSAIFAIPELRTNKAVPSALTPIRRACQQESMPICQQPARRVAPVAAGDQLELAEVGRDGHESERRVEGLLVAGEVCAQREYEFVTDRTPGLLADTGEAAPGQVGVGFQNCACT